MNHPLCILAPTRYPWRFNGPRNSRHSISNRNFLPLNKISNSIEGVTVFNPFPPRRFNLIHAFNRIPLGTTPFVIGFESHLPRAFGHESSKRFEFMSRLLASDRCRGIIAISNYARGQFLRQHHGRPWHDSVAAKLSMRYPHMPAPSAPDDFTAKIGEAVRLVFIGNHYGRKGGLVAMHLAELADKHGFPLEIDIVSTLEVGAASWVDPTRESFGESQLQRARELPNMRFRGGLPNAEVLSLIKKAHFTFLPTFSDSFGYSVIESMALGTPVVATRQCALPEFIEDRKNGIMLDLKTDDAGEWIHIAHQDRGMAAYESLFTAEAGRLAYDAFIRLEETMQDYPAYLSLRREARATASRLFSSDDANDFWDRYYEKALSK